MPTVQDTFEYKLIKNYYGEQRAERSSVLLINHIEEGLEVLVRREANIDTQRAYCLHPIFQGDTDLEKNHKFIEIAKTSQESLLLVMEYRHIANQYLSHKQINNLTEIQLSPLQEVNEMLIADKIQNRKDFEQYHAHTHPRANELTHYFKNWLERLGISEDVYLFYYQMLTNRNLTHH
jgi:hypothetical protein